MEQRLIMPGTNSKKTDNGYLSDKVRLRVDNSPWPSDSETPLRVLDLFGGHGVVWGCVERITGKKVMRTAVDERHDLACFHVHGDNRKVMSGMDLSRYDVIDVDAYGIPADQLRDIFNRKFKGTVFFTAIQTMNGALPISMLVDLGFPRKITTKAPSLPARRGWKLVCQWLALQGVRTLVHRSDAKRRKHYACFHIPVDGGY